MSLNKNMLIVDIGFWLALANQKDDAHQSATQLFQKLENKEFITTWCVVTENRHLGSIPCWRRVIILTVSYKKTS